MVSLVQLARTIRDTALQFNIEQLYFLFRPHSFGNVGKREQQRRGAIPSDHRIREPQDARANAGETVGFAQLQSDFYVIDYFAYGRYIAD